MKLYSLIPTSHRPPYPLAPDMLEAPVGLAVNPLAAVPIGDSETAILAALDGVRAIAIDPAGAGMGRDNAEDYNGRAAAKATIMVKITRIATQRSEGKSGLAKTHRYAGQFC